MFHGSMVALVTPMYEDGRIDFNSLSDLVEWHISNHTQGIILLGTTGESMTIDFSERNELLRTVVAQVNGRCPIIAGTGSSATANTIELTQHAMDVGVDACLLVTPCYNKPTQEGLFLHYQAIAQAVAVPLILYNVPGRTACDLLPETISRLSHITNIVGLKEANGNIERVKVILEQSQGKIDLYSGCDDSSLDFILEGGKGVMSVTANVAPKLMADMCQLATSGAVAQATKLQAQLMPLHENLFLESNPIPVKWVLQRMGKIRDGIRLPLTKLDPRYHEKLSLAMRQAGILSNYHYEEKTNASN